MAKKFYIIARLAFAKSSTKDALDRTLPEGNFSFSTVDFSTYSTKKPITQENKFNTIEEAEAFLATIVDENFFNFYTIISVYDLIS